MEVQLLSVDVKAIQKRTGKHPLQNALMRCERESTEAKQAQGSTQGEVDNFKHPYNLFGEIGFSPLYNMNIL